VGCVLAAIDFRFLRCLNTDKMHRLCRFYPRHRCATALFQISLAN
jgi:hypothetical protein